MLGRGSDMVGSKGTLSLIILSEHGVQLLGDVVFFVPDV